jgi:predicted ABC-type ATPase
MIRPGSKGRAVERTAISVLRGGHPYEHPQAQERFIYRQSLNQLG